MIKWQGTEGEAQRVGTLDPYIYSNLSSSLIITGHLYVLSLNDHPVTEHIHAKSPGKCLLTNRNLMMF